jgi:hypothetical protein
MDADVLNEVVLNQVLVSFGNDERTRAVIAHLQRGGEAWMSGTTWDGKAAMRISVVGFRTTVEDVDRTLVAIAEGMAATEHLATPHQTTPRPTTAHLHEGGQLAS